MCHEPAGRVMCFQVRLNEAATLLSPEPKGFRTRRFKLRYSILINDMILSKEGRQGKPVTPVLKISMNHRSNVTPLCIRAKLRLQ
jgi:hypothetical protein